MWEKFKNIPLPFCRQRPCEWPQKSRVTPAGGEVLLLRIKHDLRHKEKNWRDKTLKEHEYVLLWV